ncbi:MAG TPA: acyloxyacyl hydrolase [Tepidisphaeraceae bacterium]|nr:acyloxyacyl hydrolase [Tepidisphaeraceae bacterium]
MRISMILACVAIACVGVRPLSAAEATQPAASFPKGTFSLTLDGGYASAFDSSRATIETASVGLGYYFLDNVSMNIEFSGYGIQQPGPDAVVGGGELLLRHHLWNIDRFSIFADVGGGAWYGTARFPVGGTNFNFSVETGLGATYRLRDNLYLLGGARYLHFSNAHLEGPKRNPSINAIEGYVGVMVTF